MRSVCVFLGATLGSDEAYLRTVELLGKELAKRNLHLVYGGGTKGLMGILADTVLKNGGTVTGVITHSLYELEGHDGLTTLHKTETMQERKQMMARLAEAFIVLPGGLGTLEELFEVWNGAKINTHKKPIGILNINNFYDGLISFIEHLAREGFSSSKPQDFIKIANDSSYLLDLLEQENKNNVEYNPNQSFFSNFRGCC